jgi:hypothetical protein
VLGNFASNSFSRDQLGAGVEYALREIFMLRAGYNYELGVSTAAEAPVYSGISAGATLEMPFSKDQKESRLSIDYAFRATKVWNGTHNFSLRIGL